MPNINPLRRKGGATALPRTKAVRLGSPRWLVPLMVALFVLGLLWIVVFYLSEQRYPLAEMGNWNMGIGFALIAAGFALATQWR